MSQPTLEQRVTALEKRVAELSNGSADKPWIRTLGFFAGNTVMKEIFDEALRLREKDREKAGRRQNRRTAGRRARK